MMLPIDNFTICFAAALIAITFGVAFLAVWTRYRYAPYLIDWAAAGITYGVGIFVMLLPPRPLTLVSGTLGYLLLAGSTALIVTGIRGFERLRFARAWLVAIVVPPPLAFVLAALALPPSAIMIPPAMALTVSLAIGGAILARPRPVPLTGWRRIVGWTMLGFLPSYLLSIAAHGVDSPMLDAATRVAYLSHIPLLLLTYLGLLAMPGARAIASLRESSYRDALTGLRNRAWLADHGGRWAVTGTGVAIIDVDHFKQINDTFGHERGDAVLARIASRLRAVAEACRGEAIRLGGDEFVLLVPDLPTTAASLAAHLSRLSDAHSDLPAWRVSFGMAAWRPADGDLQPAIGRADTELYAAKRSRPLARAA